MQFSVVVNAHPSKPAAQYALEYCHAVLAGGHKLYRVFFLGDGALNCSQEYALAKQWNKLTNTDLVCCVSSAQKMTLADARGEATHLVSSSVSLGGLGQLVEAVKLSDRVVTFGQRATC